MAASKKVKVRFLTNVSYGYPVDHPDNPAVQEPNDLGILRAVPQSENFAAGDEAEMHESDVEILNSGDNPLVEVVTGKSAAAEDAE